MNNNPVLVEALNDNNNFKNFEYTCQNSNQTCTSIIHSGNSVQVIFSTGIYTHFFNNPIAKTNFIFFYYY